MKAPRYWDAAFKSYLKTSSLPFQHLGRRTVWKHRYTKAFHPIWEFPSAQKRKTFPNFDLQMHHQAGHWHGQRSNFVAPCDCACLPKKSHFGPPAQGNKTSVHALGHALKLYSDRRHTCRGGVCRGGYLTCHFFLICLELEVNTYNSLVKSNLLKEYSILVPKKKLEILCPSKKIF